MPLFTTQAPVAKFARIGDSVEGEITDVYQSQRYEYVRGGQGKPMYWLNRKPVAGVRVDPLTGKPNDPVLQAVITVDTGVPDENGDTERRIFIKNKRMNLALRVAVAAGGGKRDGLLLGGGLRCTWVGEEQGDGNSPAKLYDFEYRPPAPGEGRVPSDEVRLADREEPDEPVVAHPNPEVAARNVLDRARGGAGADNGQASSPLRDAQAAASAQRAADRDRVTTRADLDEPPF